MPGRIAALRGVGGSPADLLGCNIADFGAEGIGRASSDVPSMLMPLMLGLIGNLPPGRRLYSRGASAGVSLEGCQ